jgi:hypothetical protein
MDKLGPKKSVQHEELEEQQYQQQSEPIPHEEYEAIQVPNLLRRQRKTSKPL